MSAAIDYMKTYETIVARIVEVRRHRDVSEARLLLAILDIEDNAEEMQALKLAGCENLERFVRRLEVCDVARFRSFREGVEKLGRDHALEVGAEATIEGAKLTSAPAAAKYVEAVKAQIDERQGMLPTRETAKHLRRQIDPLPEIPQALRNKSRTAELGDEVARLEAQIAKLRAENAKLKKERDEALKRATMLSKEVSALKRKR